LATSKELSDVKSQLREKESLLKDKENEAKILKKGFMGLVTKVKTVVGEAQQQKEWAASREEQLLREHSRISKENQDLHSKNRSLYETNMFFKQHIPDLMP
jgi:hypothetical protein